MRDDQENKMFTGALILAMSVFLGLSSVSGEFPAEDKSEVEWNAAEPSGIDFHINGASSTEDYVFGAYYYPWYSNGRHWNAGYRGNPTLGEYSSRDEEVINTQISWAVDYGIDLFMMSWWGPNSWEDETIRNHFLEADLADNIKFCILYESIGRLEKNSEGRIDLDDDVNRRRLIKDFKYLENTYFDMDEYFRTNGKPVVIIYSARIFTGDIENTFSSLRETLDENLYLVGDQVYWQDPSATEQKRLMKNFEAVTAYNMHASRKNIDRNFVDKVDEKYGEWKEVAEEMDVGFIPNLLPGFDDRMVRPDENHPVVRRSPERLERFGEVCLKRADPDLNMVFITSFNEWHEYTQIEPSENYRMDYLKKIENLG